MSNCNFNNVENTLLMVIASLLMHEESNKKIIDFIDSSKRDDLEINEFVVRTKQGNYKISIEQDNK